MDIEKYWEEHSSELCKQMHELGYTPHTIVEEAFKDNMSYKEFIITFLT